MSKLEVKLATIIAKLSWKTSKVDKQNRVLYRFEAGEEPTVSERVDLAQTLLSTLPLDQRREVVLQMRDRLSAGMSQSAIAQATGLSNTHVSHFLRGTKSLSPKMAKNVEAWLAGVAS